MSHWLPPDILNKYDILNLHQEYLRACHGLADIQEQFNLNTIDISNGIIQDKKSGHKYLARGKLSSFDLFNIGTEARNSHYYEGSVNWFHSGTPIYLI